MGNKTSIVNETKLKNLTENLLQKTEGQWDEAERCRGDSVDSLICAGDTHMWMGYSYADGVLICGWGTGRLRRRLETMEVTETTETMETMETIDDDDTVDSERRE
jgi:hypothetical protein